VSTREIAIRANLRAVHYTVLGTSSLCGPSLPSGTDKGSGDQFLVSAARDERLLALGLGIERTLVEV
jgi:hypothetical protein